MKREIEKKYLLRDKAAHDQLISQLSKKFTGFVHDGQKTVISYFYKSATADQVLKVANEILASKERAELVGLLKTMGDISVRCRSIDQMKYFVVKGAPAGEDAVHTTNRLEFEVVMSQDLETINAAITKAGIELVSKWSAQRDFYTLNQDMKAQIEFVSGYGYKAELEIMIEDGEPAEATIQQLDEVAADCNLTHASDELMGRMYNYYNQHWEEFFDTDKVFSEDIWKQLGR